MEKSSYVKIQTGMQSNKIYINSLFSFFLKSALIVLCLCGGFGIQAHAQIMEEGEEIDAAVGWFLLVLPEVHRS